ncbi:Lrp/AsnC ligand binding domain-containing protein [Lutibacter sp. A80]|uniref:Lrp/AsnC family transcriptional regulator n=1 Tax=Lutibacter sp. A80 TaxID=2918453 RepID=UPI001F06A103|nr:Lrp/AsnC ligand binding domain-containing protein [Lutibacter sp. A80]UMB60008.1 Lrp/AsnC ligand binding domain-containing protein [Lutibacter sp. A80]
MKDQEITIDGIDKIILKHLMEDAKTSILAIAREIGISGAAVHQRLRKLESNGLILGSKLIINPKVLGYTTLAYVGVHLDNASKYASVIKRLKEIPEVVECHYTTGNWAVFIKVLSKDNTHLMKILNEEIQFIQGVIRTETFISLDQQINRQIGL